MIDPALVDILVKAKHILCVSHVNPDGDAVGSILGMGWMLSYLGKSITLALQDAIPIEYEELPGADAIVGEEQVVGSYDLIICLDASSPDRMGSIYQAELHQDIPLLVIDHHITNTYFGSINWVSPQCAATCQMLVYLADALAIPLNGPIAECLLTGLVTDTLCFRTSNTDAQVLEAAMRLVEGGANLSHITKQTLNRRPFSAFKLWGNVLPQVQLEDRIIWLAVTRKQLENSGYPAVDTQLSSLLITAIEADISATFREKLDHLGQTVIECSFRAKSGFDVSRLAFELGGGGHPAASGCTLQGTLQDVTRKVVPLLKKARQHQVMESVLRAENHREHSLFNKQSNTQTYQQVEHTHV